jgi:hypothetical protein
MLVRKPQKCNDRAQSVDEDDDVRAEHVLLVWGRGPRFAVWARREADHVQFPRSSNKLAAVATIIIIIIIIEWK